MIHRTPSPTPIPREAMGRHLQGTSLPHISATLPARHLNMAQSVGSGAYEDAAVSVYSVEDDVYGVRPSRSRNRRMDREPLEAAEGNLREAKSDPDLMDINPPGAIGSGGQFPPDRPPGR